MRTGRKANPPGLFFRIDVVGKLKISVKRYGAFPAEKRVVISVNASVPIENQKWVDESDDERVQLRGLTFDFNLMTVRECGYSFIVGTGIGGAKTQSDSGIDAVFVKRFSDTFGIFAGIDISTNLGGAMVYTITEENVCVIGYGSDSWGFGIAPGLVNVVPRFGISWLLD